MLPQVLKDYVEDADKSEQSKMLKQLAKITEESGFEKALEALTHSIEYGGKDVDSVFSIYTRLNEKFPDMSAIQIPGNVPDMPPVKRDLNIYDEVLNKGGVH